MAYRRLAARTYEHFIEINFIKTPKAIGIFDGVQSASDILLRLSTFTDVPMVPGKTFILFDEIQDCKECVTQIKFLVDEGSFRYGLTGSLLGVELNDVRSEPVGYMDVVDVFPLDFEEFALAIGVAPKVIDALRNSFEGRTPVDPVVHSQMMSVFNLYLIVGGMPAAVWKYIQTKNMQHVAAEQRAIIKIYKRDIARYDKKAGVAIPVFNVEEPRVPLLLNKQRNLLKLFQDDVGLLAYQYADGIQLRILRGEANINHGAIYENVVAQELLAHGFEHLYYFNNKKQGEVDFVLEKGDGTILPVEVKSGKDYAFHLALNNILSNAEYNIPEAIVLCNDNVRVDGKVVYLPVYTAMFLQRKREINAGEYIPDISALQA